MTFDFLHLLKSFFTASPNTSNSLLDESEADQKNSPGDANILFIYSLPKDDDINGGTTLLFKYWFEGEGLVVRSKLDLDCTPDKILKPINGLVCFCRYVKASVLIYNPTTGERTSWIESTTSDDEEIEGIRNTACNFGFGFDPITKEHKVICIFRTTNTTTPDLTDDDYEEVTTDRYFCEVLTVGENRWRRIDEVVPPYLEGDSVSANGSIYWRHRGEDGEAEVLVAFDVGSEKFRVIPIPDFVIDPDRYKWSQTVELLEVDGRIAVLDWVWEQQIDLWIFDDDDDDDDKDENGTSNSNTSNWIKESIYTPFMWNGKPELLIEAIDGTDLIILKCCELLGDPLYYYKRNKFVSTEFQVDDDDTEGLKQITSFVESHLPVEKHHHQYHSNDHQPPLLGH